MKKNHYTIRLAREEDVDQVFEIEKASFGQWKRNYFIAEFDNNFSFFIVAEQNNKIIGFAVAWNVVGEIQLNNIGVKNDYRRQGIGISLIDHIVKLLEPENPEKILIEVKETNHNAKLFYKKIGFIETGKRLKYYGNDNALLMERSLK